LPSVVPPDTEAVAPESMVRLAETVPARGLVPPVATTSTLPAPLTETDEVSVAPDNARGADEATVMVPPTVMALMGRVPGWRAMVPVLLKVTAMVMLPLPLLRKVPALLNVPEPPSCCMLIPADAANRDPLLLFQVAPELKNSVPVLVQLAVPLLLLR